MGEVGEIVGRQCAKSFCGNFGGSVNEIERSIVNPFNSLEFRIEIYLDICNDLLLVELINSTNVDLLRSLLVGIREESGVGGLLIRSHRSLRLLSQYECLSLSKRHELFGVALEALTAVSAAEGISSSTPMSMSKSMSISISAIVEVAEG